MYIQPHQLHQILSPKKACQRGLEEYIVEQHFGDKTSFGGFDRHQHFYINNPVYRVGAEGDPAPLGVSSRHSEYFKKLGLNQSALHLLYPEINSGSIFLSQEPWDQRWNYAKSNIPNQIASHFEGELGGIPDVIRDQEETANYNLAVLDRDTFYSKKNKKNRVLPIYQPQHISTDEQPDGIHAHPTHDVYKKLIRDKPTIINERVVDRGANVSITNEVENSLDTGLFLPSGLVPDLGSYNLEYPTVADVQGIPPFREENPIKERYTPIKRGCSSCNGGYRSSIENQRVTPQKETFEKVNLPAKATVISNYGYPQPDKYGRMGIKEDEYNNDPYVTPEGPIYNPTREYFELLPKEVNSQEKIYFWIILAITIITAIILILLALKI